MEKLNITPGKWKEYDNGVITLTKIYSNIVCKSCVKRTSSYEYWNDNAKLIADAGTTYNATPILPSELLKQRNELKMVLENLVHKCLHTDGYNQKYQELYDAQQVLQNSNNA